jgi:hypothetical protein
MTRITTAAAELDRLSYFCSKGRRRRVQKDVKIQGWKSGHGTDDESDAVISSLV